MTSAPEQLGERFTYKPDTGDSWSFLTGNEQVWGDCEDFSLTVAYLESKKSKALALLSIFFCRHMFWYCTYKGEGHLVTYKIGSGWTDNIQKRWVKNLGPDYKLKFPYGPLAVFVYFIKRITG